MKQSSKIEWQDEYAIDIKEIDEQHQKLFSILNELIKIRSTTRENHEYKNIFMKLMDYTQYHFDTERQYYKGTKFEKLQEEEHKYFIDKLMELATQFLHNEKYIDDQLLFFLINWLKKHLLTTDKECFDNIKQDIK